MLEPRRRRTATRRSSNGAARAPSTAALDDFVDRFWVHHAKYRTLHRPTVRALGEAALTDEPQIAEAATQRLFARIIEPLCDGFTARGVETYRQTFAELVTVARRANSCREFASALRTAGLGSRRALLAPRPGSPLPRTARDDIAAAIVLSRLTLGADVAISVPILRHLRAILPNAEICFAGPAVSAAIARAVPGVDHLPVEYGRGATLANRLNAWPNLCNTLSERIGRADADRCLLIDPDSRLTQLGLLRPPCGRAYFHFPSRSFAAQSTEPLGVLVRHWLAEHFGATPHDTTAPFAIDSNEHAWAAALRSTVAQQRPVVVISFGIGADARKRLGRDFEYRLVDSIVQRGCCVWMARGVTAEEAAECRHLCRRFDERGVPIAHWSRHGTPDTRPAAPAIVTFEGSVDRFVAAIAEADAYVGYDSAGQHIAAAVGTPVLTVFVEAAGPRHAMRWTPYGPGPIAVVRAHSNAASVHAVAERTERALDGLIGRDAKRTPKHSGIVASAGRRPGAAEAGMELAQRVDAPQGG